MDGETQSAADVDEKRIRVLAGQITAYVRAGQFADARRCIQALALIHDREGRSTRARKLRRYMFSLVEVI